MLIFLLIVMYFCCGVITAAVMRDEIGSHDTSGAVIVLLLWPLVLVLGIIFFVLKLIGYK